MSIPQQKEAQEPRRYTYADYETWPEDSHIELIDGLPYRYGELITDLPEALTMSAAPVTAHQRVALALSSQLYGQLKEKPCEAFIAPFEVRLQLNEDGGPIVQPDIAIVCDPAKITKKGCEGAPDVIMEILSPSTARHDQITKLQLYQDAGVKEYWIVDPERQIVQVNSLDNGRYFITMYTEKSTIPVQALDGCQVDMQEVFSFASSSPTD